MPTNISSMVSLREKAMCVMFSLQQELLEPKVLKRHLFRVRNFRHDLTPRSVIFPSKTLLNVFLFQKSLIRQSEECLLNFLISTLLDTMKVFVHKWRKHKPLSNFTRHNFLPSQSGLFWTGCDVTNRWLIQIQKKCQASQSVLPRPWFLRVFVNQLVSLFASLLLLSTATTEYVSKHFSMLNPPRKPKSKLKKFKLSRHSS